MKCSREYGQCHESSAGGTLKFQGLNFMTLLASFNNMSAASIIVSLLAIYYMHIVLLCMIYLMFVDWQLAYCMHEFYGPQQKLR